MLSFLQNLNTFIPIKNLLVYKSANTPDKLEALCLHCLRAVILADSFILFSLLAIPRSVYNFP